MTEFRDTYDLTGWLVQVWIPNNQSTQRQHHARIGKVTEFDEDDLISVAPNVKVEFDDSTSMWCWRRELKPVSSPEDSEIAAMQEELFK